MTKKQIKELYPEVYNEIFQEGLNSCSREQGHTDTEYYRTTLIGNVPICIIHEMADTIEKLSMGNWDKFKQMVWDGKWSEYSIEYIHPVDELTRTRCFKLIQEAFINAYV